VYHDDDMKSGSKTSYALPESEIQSGAETYSSAMGDAVNYFRWILDEFQPFMGKSLLEVGLGHGSYRACLPTDLQYFGIDIDADSVAQAQRKYPGDTILEADIADRDFAAAFKGKKIDSVICINVLEHVLDHRLAVKNLIEIMEPGGHLFLFVPAFQALYTALDQLAGHHRRYRKADLEALVPPTAKVVVSKYFNSIGGFGWWVNGFFKHKSLNDGAVNTQIAVFDKYVLPFSRMLNPITGPWFGQSAILVVRKK
jgi:SAM-dependent methyltransferase